MSSKLKGALKFKGNTGNLSSMFARLEKREPLSDVDSELPPQTDQVDQVTKPVSSPGLPEQPEEEATNSLRSRRISYKPPVIYNYDDAERVVSEVLVAASDPELEATSTAEPAAASNPELEAASTGEPAADSNPNPAAASTSATTFSVPEWLQKRHDFPLRTYVIRHMFTGILCNRIARKYRLAVYSHCNDGSEVQSRAVQAVLNHELDHKDTTPQQKIYYHRLCDEGCGFNKWLAAGNTAETYLKTTYKNYLGK